MAEKSATYLEGICHIIKACGEYGVHELHLGDLSLFLTPSGTMLPQARKPVVTDPETGDFVPTRRAEGRTNAAEEKQKRIEEIRARQLEDPGMLDLESPMAYEERLLRELKAEEKQA